MINKNRTSILRLFVSFRGTGIRRLLVVLSILLSISAGLRSQITSPEAIYSEQTNYPSGTTNDILYYYNSINDGSLTIAPADQATYTFNWYRYNQGNNSFDIHLSTETGISSSISGLTETGYRVTADDGNGTVTTYTCWTLQPEIISVDLEMLSESCYELQLNAVNTTKDLNYYDPANGEAVSVDYGLTYTWISEPEGSDEDNPVSGETEQQINIKAPVEDTDFTVSVGAKFGIAETATTHYIAIAVKAIFEQTPEGRGIENEMDTTKKHSAPLVVRFSSDEAKGNNLAYEWTFGEDGRAYEANTLHTYQVAGTYENILHVINEISGCEDTSEPQEIIVFESDLQVPNVFTPNGDGINDEFRVAYRSIKKYNITIFNRWGRKVYSSTNPAQGWDGRIGKGQASPGVYFYVIEAEGYQKEERYKMHGTITLIRGK